MNTIPNEKEILGFLLELGDDPFAVAASLERLGIKGRRGACRTCPIARYLVSKGMQKVAVDLKVAPAGFSFWITITHEFDGDARFSTNLEPKLLGVARFIANFDMGSYGQLVSLH
jgi:hypothetical protein